VFLLSLSRLTQCRRVLLHKSTVAHLVKKFPIFMQLATDYRVYKSLHNSTHGSLKYAVAKNYLQCEPKAQFMGF